ncbi:MAG TPA: iron-containing alcohol dehydrogenase [Paracoccaceae bacterium]|nr:iron-containing alcohol dehydrogenase [Paracoccaceae bacterium]
MSFEMSFVPAWRFGAGLAERIGPVAAPLAAGRPVLIVADPFWVTFGLVERMAASLAEAGLPSVTHSDIAGEPKLAQLEAAIAAARSSEAGLVIGIGGGSALDLAKAAAALMRAEEGPEAYCGVVRDLPRERPARIMIPTTAGTGSEFSATNIVALPSGRKSWIWGTATKPDLVILDPALAASLPPALTAWCGMDAFVHAFEACTSRNAHAGVEIVAHEALRRIARALPLAVEAGGDIAARGEMLIGSGLAGQAIDNCGTAIAHNLAHALAGLAPVHHGLATALAYELTLPWLCAQDNPGIVRAAAALGLNAAELPGFVTDLMDRCGFVRALPPAFARFGVADLMREIEAEENRPMLKATMGDFPKVAEATAAHLLALAEGSR